MPVVDIDGLLFTIDPDCLSSRYDSWSFYRNQWGRARPGLKAIDLLVVTPAKVVWFVEVKDYRQHPRTKVIDLADEVAAKVCDTLAAMLPARIHANDEPEQRLAQATLRGTRLRVVLHLEQPTKHSKLFPRAIDPADVLQKLRQRVRAIDPHPVVCERATVARHGAPWSVA